MSGKDRDYLSLVVATLLLSAVAFLVVQWSRPAVDAAAPTRRSR